MMKNINVFFNKNLAKTVVTTAVVVPTAIVSTVVTTGVLNGIARCFTKRTKENREDSKSHKIFKRR